MPATPLLSVSVMFVFVSVFATLATLHFMVMLTPDNGVVHFAALSGETTICSFRMPMSGSGTTTGPARSLLVLWVISTVLSLLVLWALQCAGSTSVVAVLLVSVVMTSARCRVTATLIFSAYRLPVVVVILLRAAALGVVVYGCRCQVEVACDARSPVMIQMHTIFAQIPVIGLSVGRAERFVVGDEFFPDFG